MASMKAEAGVMFQDALQLNRVTLHLDPGRAGQRAGHRA